jgi:hypothetical protein
MKYLVSHQGEAKGPFTIDEIVGMVRGKELELFDYVFDDSKQDWVLLMEFPRLADQLKSNKPPRPAHADTQVPAKPDTASKKGPDNSPKLAKVIPIRAGDAHTISEWFVLKGENRFGPFNYTDLVKMLQQKVVFPFDFIWHAGLTNWQRVAEIEDFKPEVIRELFTKNGKATKDVFTERKFRRKQFAGRMLIHDNLTLWKGDGFEISKGGVGVSMANSVVVPGQQVFVHFKKFESYPAFNAVCEVVSKKFVNDNSPVQYGLRFLSVSQEVQDEFFKKVA